MTMLLPNTVTGSQTELLFLYENGFPWAGRFCRRDRTSAAGGQAMDGLSAGLGGQPIRPQRSSRRQNRPALPTTMMIFIVRCDLQSWGLYENHFDRL